MRLRWICKSAGSRDEGDCPAMYLAEDPTYMVGQGRQLDDATIAELANVADDEAALLYPTEMILRAAALVLAEHGRPDMLSEVESFLSTWDGPTR